MLSIHETEAWIDWIVARRKIVIAKAFPSSRLDDVMIKLWKEVVQIAKKKKESVRKKASAK